MLTQTELKQIKELQELCEKEGNFQLKLNFDMLKNREGDKKEDFFQYEQGKLVGFLGSYGFGKTVELCGMVHPNYRRRGIFSCLLKMGLDEAKKHNMQVVLLNAPTESLSATEFLKHVPCFFAFAEYQMKWQETELVEDSMITVRPSISDEDNEAEIQLEVLGFGFAEEEAREYQETLMKNNEEQRLLIEAEGKVAGKMRVAETNKAAWIYGFTVFPELRGKGIGRKALGKVVKMEQKKGLAIYLEVEAKNSHALKLYESCGFKSYHSQDYYKCLL
ncbi:GNAT family N-acetyltransferase [Niallia nealsonii]|uniref:N-acetyltransferase n=1 Tax=Niallia nealsonii TaxID=115979 RepID=A0A2N0Z040_9BACI|nr:GNAT family N-acetyltransferase [Niallia nealsonii]PKG22883.1 N-acetyltransferase [Niallia nealsonii]